MCVTLVQSIPMRKLFGLAKFYACLRAHKSQGCDDGGGMGGGTPLPPLLPCPMMYFTSSLLPRLMTSSSSAPNPYPVTSSTSSPGASFVGRWGGHCPPKGSVCPNPKDLGCYFFIIDFYLVRCIRYNIRY